MLGTLLALGCLGWATSTAAAQDEPSAGAREHALAMFGEGVEAYRDGRFEDASRLFRDAYATFPEAVLLYNFARAEENLGHWRSAADAYEQYLAEAADAEDRAGIERRVITLRARAAEAEATPREDPVLPAPEPPRGSAIPWGAIATGGAGIVALLTAVALGQSAVDLWARAREEPVHLDAVRLEANAADLALGANVAYGLAGAVLAAAVVSLIVELAE